MNFQNFHGLKTLLFDASELHFIALSRSRSRSQLKDINISQLKHINIHKVCVFSSKKYGSKTFLFLYAVSYIGFSISGHSFLFYLNTTHVERL